LTRFFVDSGHTFASSSFISFTSSLSAVDFNIQLQLGAPAIQFLPAPRKIHLDPLWLSAGDQPAMFPSSPR
jgi:hypothetical protein